MFRHFTHTIHPPLTLIHTQSGDSRGSSPIPPPRRKRGISIHSPHHHHQHHPKPPFKRQESIVSVAKKPSRPRASTMNGIDAAGLPTVSNGDSSPRFNPHPLLIHTAPRRSPRVPAGGLMIPIPDSPIDDFSLLVGDDAVPFEKIIDRRKKKP
jgi:hypothetical protein